jgi:hypothetical protein
MKTSVLSDEQLAIAARIDAHIQALERADVVDDLQIFEAMVNEMRSFDSLVNAATQDAMDELYRRYAGFQRYSTVLMAAALRIGRITALLPLAGSALPLPPLPPDERA